MFCSLVYPEQCKFFIWDRIKQLCEVFDYEMSQYLSSCKVLGGTPEPGLADCEDVVDDCQVETDPKKPGQDQKLSTNEKSTIFQLSS